MFGLEEKDIVAFDVAMSSKYLVIVFLLVVQHSFDALRDMLPA